MANKLYPPYIEGTLPAFCISYDSSNTVVKEATIDIPFTPNVAVGQTEVKGLILRLRTASTGSYLFEPIQSISYSLDKGIATFKLTANQAKLLNEGQYYKIQIAYVSSENDPGYFSTVGVIKCTSKPKIYINNLSQESVNFFTNYYIGTYDQSECRDQSEKVYSYEFNVYNDDNEIIYTTGERLHQTSYDVDYSYSIDKAIVNDFSATNVTYAIEYKVTTLNGLVLTTPKYKLTNEDLVSPNEEIAICPEANKDNGYITIHFKGSLDLNRSWYYILKEEQLASEKVNGQYAQDANGRTAISVVKNNLQGQSNKIGFLKKYSFFKIYSNTYKEPGYIYVWANNTPSGKTLYDNKYYDTTALNNILDNIELSEEQKQEALNNLTYYELISSGRNLVNNLSYKYVKDNYIDITEYPVVDSVPYEAFYYGSYILSRSSDKDNYSTWETIGQFRLDEQAPSQFSIRDMTVEHGRKYIYGLQQTNIWGLVSSRIKSDPYEVSFEDMFLFDGDKLLKIRFNPKVESFKTKILEQKTDTIGGRFPYITRNGATYYKEFPIGGLIAHEMDEDQMFHKRIQGVAHRHSTSAKQEKYDKDGNLIEKADMPENGLRDWHMFSDENMLLEREFKLAVLDWLNDGKPKLFKSPYEGNYIIRLLNNELKPVEELGRMLHTFTSQAYEIAECNYENLVNYGFINTTAPSKYVGLWRTYQLTDPELLNASGDIEITFDAGLETFTVQDLMPGDIIYLEFFDGTVEPIMIGITGSYTYTVGADKPVRKLTISPHSEIEQTSSRNTVGIVNCYYQGVRITAFDAILSQQLRTIPSQQYIGVSPWLENAKRTQWDAQDNYGQSSFDLSQDQYKELQNYNFRDYLDDTVNVRENNSSLVTYKINENFQKYMYSFDPGELLERISLTLNRGEVYKTQLLNIEQAHFRLRDIIPVYIIEKHPLANAADFKYQRKDGPFAPEAKSDNSYQYMVATSPYGYPHRIEELTEYEMIDPFCIYEVFELDSNHSWFPVQRVDGPYYDPYYRTWAKGYDPTYKINYQWKKIIWAPDENTANLLEQYKQEELYKKNRDKPYDSDYLYDYIVYKELTQDNDDPSLQVYKYYYNDNKGNKVLIKDGFDLFYKEGTRYFSYGNTTGIFSNTGISNSLTEEEKKKKIKDFIFFIKEYDSVISLATIKEKHYTNLKDINSIHIGNAVMAELTFQIKIIDYYTEVKDAKVREAKDAYLQAKEFYMNLMKNYSLIADADYYRTKYSALKNIYNILIKGNISIAQLTEQDRKTLFNLLKNNYEVEQLNLLKLYKVESINPDLETSIINKLITYKMNHLEEERYNIDNVKMLYYSSEGSITFYILDNNDIKIPSYDLESDEEYDYTYFRELKDNGNIIYYKVDLNRIKQLYFNANGENAFLNTNGLSIIYSEEGYTENNINYFINNINNLQNNQINNILQLEESVDIPTVQDVQLLNNEQVEELKNQDTFINLEEIIYNENIQEKTFFEFESLEDYVNNLTKVEGVEDKAKDLQEEIDKFNDQITELTDTINSETETYIKIFNDLQKYINDFNDKIYTSWAYQEMINLLAKGETIEFIRRVFAGQTEEIKIKIDENLTKLTRYISSAKNLYYLMLDALPKINRYQQMKNDGINPTGENDEDLDNYLEKQIMEKRGNLVLYILAMYDAIDKAINLIKENPDYKLQYKSQIIDIINYYNELYSLVISSNSTLQLDYYNSMKDFIQNKINEFNTLYTIELSLLEESYSYTNPETYATLCNYYDDIDYLKNWRYPQGENIKNSIIFDNDEYKVFKIKLPVSGEENKFNDDFFTNPSSLAISINPMWKIEFREEQDRFSQYQFNLFQTGKLLNTYHYHVPVYIMSSGFVKINMENYKTFIFYPLAETYKDEDQDISIRDERAIADGGPGIPETQNNKQFLESLPMDQQQEILDVSGILSSKILYFIDNIRNEKMGDREILKNYLIKTYFQDGETKKELHPDSLNAIREKILDPSQQEEGEDYENNPYIIYNNKILYAQSQSGVDPEHYAKLLPRPETREYFYMSQVYTENINANNNIQAKSLTFRKEDLEKFGKVYTDILTNKPTIQETYSDDNDETENPSIYPDYLNKIGKEELESLQELLTQANQLLHLYEQQYENYLSKFNEYTKIYEEYNTIYNQFQGTEEMDYYQNKNNMTIEDYRQKVKEAWWAFLNILDYTYTKERERGLYA